MWITQWTINNRYFYFGKNLIVSFDLLYNAFVNSKCKKSIIILFSNIINITPENSRYEKITVEEEDAASIVDVVHFRLNIDGECNDEYVLLGSLLANGIFSKPQIYDDVYKILCRKMHNKKYKDSDAILSCKSHTFFIIDDVKIPPLINYIFS